MEEQLKQPQGRVAGVKQVLRAIRDGKAQRVYLAKDAEMFLYRQVESACEQAAIALERVETMQELGKMCCLGVGTAAAALIKAPQ